MRKLCFLFIMCILAGSVWAGEVLIPADVSCRTEMLQPDTNRTDSAKLSIRSDASAAKSWIKFDITALEDPCNIRKTELRLTLHETEADYTFDVSAVNDDCLDNITWMETSITWNNAPANDTDDQYNPDFTKATLMGAVDLTGNNLAGSQHFLDVSTAIESDTDGIVQFILHNTSSLTQVATHDHASGEEYWPTLVVTYPPLGADWPIPENKAVVKTDLAALSWTNPDPNDEGGHIYCDVYLGEPNVLPVDMVSLGADVETVAINETNFPYSYDEVNGGLYDNTTYIWWVDCHDGDKTIDGDEWTFSTYDNEPPHNVNAGEDQVTWMTNDPCVLLVGTAEDDGLPLSGELTTTWEETEGPGTSVITSPDQLSTTVSFVERGDYTFTLTADDGELQTTDTVRVAVGDDACDASHISTGDPYNANDGNEDCMVDLVDFAALLAEDWLNCTDTLTNCGN